MAFHTTRFGSAPDQSGTDSWSVGCSWFTVSYFDINSPFAAQLFNAVLTRVTATGKEIISARDEEESFCLVHTLEDALDAQTMEDSD